MKAKGGALAADSKDPIKEAAFYPSPQGKSVLAIGSDSGRLCVEALERGASRAMALELNREQLRQAQVMADSASVFPEFQTASIDDVELGSFDIVLLLDALARLRDPISILRKLALATRDRLMIEAPSLAADKKWITGRLQGWLERRRFRSLNAYPMVYAGTRSGEQNFIFTAAALRSLLDGHMRLFQRVEELASKHEGKFLLRCVRLKIDRLVVVSGVNSSGKSTLCKNLARNELRDEIGIPDLSTAVFAAPSMLKESPIEAIFPQSETPLGLFHYDISSVGDRDLNHYARDPSTDLLRCAAHIDFIIVAPKRETLNEQLVRAGKERYIELFDQPGHLAQLHTDWIEFCGSMPATSRFFIFKEEGGVRRLVPQTSKADALSEVRMLYG
jgi:hypothetical protein